MRKAVIFVIAAALVLVVVSGATSVEGVNDILRNLLAEPTP